MCSRHAISLRDLLNDPDIQVVIGNDSQALDQRRDFPLPVCSAFTHTYTIVQDLLEHRFDIDKEARRQLPHIIDNKVQGVKGVERLAKPLKKRYGQKRNIGIVFSGGPAPGGHNVVAGLYDAARKANPDTTVYGFLMGPEGLIENRAIALNDTIVDAYRNLGGFSMIKTGRTKIDPAEQTARFRATCRKLELDALIIVGGDGSNSSVAFWAERLHGDNVQVIGVPKTIDGDVQVRDADGEVLCAISFGFHSAARAIANNISNLCIEAASTAKTWHVCKVMGRAASHIALEVALQTHANLTLIGEDLADYMDHQKIARAEAKGSIDFSAYGISLRRLIDMISDTIVRRAAVGKNYGVIVIPEGVLEFINEIQTFIIKLNKIIGDYDETHDVVFHDRFPGFDDKLEYLRRLARQLEGEGKSAFWSNKDNGFFNELPAIFQQGLLMERDSSGNFPFTKVNTEQVIIEMVENHLKGLTEIGKYKIGIMDTYYCKTLQEEGLDPDFYGPILFRNFGNSKYLLLKETIISAKTLRQVLINEQVIDEDGEIPVSIEKIFSMSVPRFKTQSHFYGYDGRGSDPSPFDSIYTYNLGQTAFSLIANGATGQMAAIKHLEYDFSKWEPLGIPIAPLMRLEEKRGKQVLAMAKSFVNLESPAFRLVRALREKWLAAVPHQEHYRKPEPFWFSDFSAETRPITLTLNAAASKKREWLHPQRQTRKAQATLAV